MLITKYFPKLTEKQTNQFVALDSLYRDWNAKINVISRKDIDSLYEKHVLHSLAISKVLKLKPGTDILDIGTGGGFPGIPLAILHPDIKFHLVDSIGKKITVVNAVIESLELKNVKASNIRAEQVTGFYDFIVSRGVAAANDIIFLTKKKLSSHHFHNKPNGWLLLKGGDLSAELKEVKRYHQLYPIEDYFNEPYFKEKYVVYIKGGK